MANVMATDIRNQIAGSGDYVAKNGQEQSNAK